MSVHDLAYGAVRHARAISGIGRSRNYRHLEVAIVLLLPDDVRAVVQRWRLDILRRFGRCPDFEAPPHITLKMGFKCEDVDAVAARVSEIAAAAPPIELSIDGFGQFEEGILFLDVAENAAFEALRQAVLTSVAKSNGVTPRPVEVSGFHPHVTLVRDLPRRQFLDVVEQFAGVPARFDCVADRVGLMVSIDDRWVDYMNCRLGSGGGKSA